MKTFSVFVIGAFLALSIGCKKDAPSAAPAAAAPAAHGKPGAKPGSHEDWCAEHEVPESQCTRCNAELIPAFKATGDWCEEHSVPESQCVQCDPSRKMTRPPKEPTP